MNGSEAGVLGVCEGRGGVKLRIRGAVEAGTGASLASVLVVFGCGVAGGG